MLLLSMMHYSTVSYHSFNISHFVLGLDLSSYSGGSAFGIKRKKAVSPAVVTTSHTGNTIESTGDHCHLIDSGEVSPNTDPPSVSLLQSVSQAFDERNDGEKYLHKLLCILLNWQ